MHSIEKGLDFDLIQFEIDFEIETSHHQSQIRLNRLIVEKKIFFLNLYMKSPSKFVSVSRH